MKRGERAILDKEYDKAEKQFLAALECDDCIEVEQIQKADKLAKEARNLHILSYEEAIKKAEKLRKDAVRAQKQAEAAEEEAIKSKAEAETSGRIAHNMIRSLRAQWNNDPKLALKIAHYNWMAHDGNRTAAEFFVEAAKDTSFGYYPPQLKLPDPEKGLTGHSNEVTFITFSNDGNKLMTCGRDSTIRLWSTNTGELLQVFKSDRGQILSGDISPEGNNIVSTNRDSTADVWDVATGQILFSLVGHTDQIISTAFSSEGDYILTGSKDHTAKLWDAKSGEKLDTYRGHTEPVWSVCFSSDDRYLLTAGSDQGNFIVWDRITTEPLVEEYVYDQEYQDWNGEEVWYARFSPDDKYILTASGDKKVRIWTWDPSSGYAEPEREFVGHTDDVESAVFSPDGKYILSGSWDGAAILWEVSSGKLKQRFSEHRDKLWSVAYSPDGTFIGTAGRDSTIRLWRIVGNDVEREFSVYSAFETPMISKSGIEGHSIRSVNISPDGRYYVTCGFDQKAVIWDASEISDPKPTELVGHTGYVLASAFSVDGRQLFTTGTDSTIFAWETATGKMLREVGKSDEAIIAIDCSPDGRYIATGSKDHLVSLWDFNTGKLVKTFKGHKEAVWSVDFSPDGNSLVTAGSRDSTAIIWDIESGKKTTTLRGHKAPVWYARFSPDGKQVATCGRDRTAIIWNASSGQPIQTLKGHTSDVEAVDYSFDGKYLATASWDGSITIWDAKRGREVKTFSEHDDYVFSVKFSPDRNYIATGSPDGFLRIWQISAIINKDDLAGHQSGITTVDASADGKYFMTGAIDSMAVLWEINRGKPLSEFREHTAPLTSVRLSPNGKYALTSSREKKVLLWKVNPDTTSGVVKHRLTEHNGQVNAACFSNNGKWAATGGIDRFVCLWNVETGALKKKLLGDGSNVYSIAFSPNDSLLLVGGKEEWILWDIKNSRKLINRPVVDDSLGMYSVCFSKNGEHVLLGGGSSGKVEVWDVAQKRFFDKIDPPHFLGHGVTSLQVSPNGRLILVARENGMLQVFERTTLAELQRFDLYNQVYDACFSHDDDGKNIFVANGTTKVPMLRDVFNRYDIATDYTENDMASAGVLLAPQDLLKVNDPAVLYKMAKDIESVNDTLAFQLYEKALDGNPTTDFLIGYYELGQKMGLDTFSLLLNWNDVAQLDTIADYFQARKEWEKEKSLREQIFNLDKSGIYLWKLYESYRYTGDRFDFRQFLDLTSAEDLTWIASRLADYGVHDYAFKLYERADEIEHSFERVIGQYVSAKQVGIDFDESLIFGATDPKELYEYGFFFLYDEDDKAAALELFEKAEAIEHDFDKLLIIYQLSEELGVEFDFNRMLSSKNEIDLREYKDYFFDIGREIRGDNRYDDALVYYEKGVQLADSLLSISDSYAYRVEISRQLVFSSWARIMTEDFAAAEMEIRKGMQLDEDNPYHYNNLPHALLFQGKYEEAEQAYMAKKDEPFLSASREESFRDIFLEDFETFLNRKIVPEEHMEKFEAIKMKLKYGK